ncbi:MAG TPA: 16S rRNA (guanine(527)-N(7))-methyltransferase RsmG [Bacilli bacterium]|nr:16S rRNA (guanine(527)-N(7))-methyltransferase RsmG [Bacilli bacterium]HPZ23257.1 16S rRNA (guanine(527)-N(7))-methyltransferase RsmG [Bacilli bacterium]HQC83274.1 16S rRNA (guanine(527)-N(7))-methyltransferase RsmG [Bacilli bacterium]
MNKEDFIKELAKLNIKLSDEQLNKLENYANFLIEYNKHTNLTTITDINDIYLKHFYDSLTIVKATDFTRVNTLIDVGSGAGFPGLVIKIVFPNINVTLLDSNNKKITFLNEVISLLKLENIKTVNSRSEDYALKHLDEFDVVTARAVTDLQGLTEICLPMVKVGGLFIPLKGNVDEELKYSYNIINKLNGSLVNNIDLTLPDDVSKRSILVIKKNSKTPSGYPRSYSKIKNDIEKRSKIK